MKITHDVTKKPSIKLRSMRIGQLAVVTSNSQEHVVLRVYNGAVSLTDPNVVWRSRDDHDAPVSGAMDLEVSLFADGETVTLTQ